MSTITTQLTVSSSAQVKVLLSADLASALMGSRETLASAPLVQMTAQGMESAQASTPMWRKARLVFSHMEDLMVTSNIRANAMLDTEAQTAR